MSNDLMGSISWLFSLHDDDNDGFLTKDEVLQLSESLLVGLNLLSLGCRTEWLLRPVHLPK